MPFIFCISSYLLLYNEDGTEDIVSIEGSWVGDVIEEKGTYNDFDFNQQFHIAYHGAIIFYSAGWW